MFAVKDSTMTYLELQSHQKGKYLQKIFKPSQKRRVFKNTKRAYRTGERTNMKTGTPGQRLGEE